MARRTCLAFAGLAAGMALVALLFARFSLTPSDIANGLAAIPAEVFIAVTALTLANQVIGVIRWQMVNAALFPKERKPGFVLSLAATSWGSFLGQLLPLQIAMAAARWLMVRGRGAVGSTVFEQLVDLVILVAGAGSALLVLIAGIPMSVGVALFAAAILIGTRSMRLVFAMGAKTLSGLGHRRARHREWSQRWANSLAQASTVPARLMNAMIALSLIRLVVLMARMVMVALVLAGPINPLILAIGYPVIGLSLGVPFAPAGLGIADWTWTGLLVLSGAAASLAALTALVARCLNFASLLVIVLPVTGWAAVLARKRPRAPVKA